MLPKKLKTNVADVLKQKSKFITERASVTLKFYCRRVIPSTHYTFTMDKNFTHVQLDTEVHGTVTGIFCEMKKMLTTAFAHSVVNYFITIRNHSYETNA